MLIRLQIISSWYMWDIYFWKYGSNFYQLNMSWIFIRTNRTLISIHADMSWIFIKLIRLQIISTWYVLDIYFWKYGSNFYQLDMSWIFIRTNRTLISINVDMSWIFISGNMLPFYQLDMFPILFPWIDFGYLSTLTEFSFLFPWISNPNFYSCWYVLEIYQHE